MTAGLSQKYPLTDLSRAEWVPFGLSYIDSVLNTFREKGLPALENYVKQSFFKMERNQIILFPMAMVMFEISALAPANCSDIHKDPIG